jgi:large subunit ribosomal protein L21
MHAVVEDRNQQYRVATGDRVMIALNAAVKDGDRLTFDRVCLLTGASPRIGTPFVPGASVTATVLRAEVKGPKLVVAKYKRRKNERRRTGFRAKFTEIRVDSIEV